MPIRIRTAATKSPILPAMLVGTALLLAAAGCSSRHPPLLLEPIAGSADATVSVAPIAIDVRNQLGSVRVLVDPQATQTEVQTLRVVVRVTEGEPEWTDVVIRTASVRGIIIRNTEGDIELDGVEGPIDIQSGEPLRTKGGGVFVRASAPLTSSVAIATTRGDVRVKAPSASTGQVTLESSARLVSLMGRAVQSAGVVSGPRSWQGTINGGTNPVRISSTTGAVVLEFFE